MVIHPELVSFYRSVWTAAGDDIPSSSLDAVYLRDRMRSDLSKGLGHPISWEEVFDICVRELKIPAAFLETPLEEYTFAFMQLANAWLVTRFPRANHNKILAVAHVIGSLCSDSAAFGPPDDRATYRKARTIADSFGEAELPAATDRLIDQIIEACL